MENIVESVTDQLKRGIDILRNNSLIQYGALALYLLLWLLFSGFLSTIWVALGVGIGWLLGKGPAEETTIDS